MTIADLRVQIAAYANREQAEFVRGGADLLLLAINRAKLAAQRSHDFEFLRDRLTVTVNSATGVPYPTSPLLKKVERAFLNLTPEPILIEFASRHSTVVTNYREVNQIDYAAESARLAAADPASKISLYMQGLTLRLMPFPTVAFPFGDASVLLDVIVWSPDYVAPAETDFFLIYGPDFMMYRSVMELNKYLKQPEKIQLAAESVTESWTSFVMWDRSLCSDQPVGDLRQPSIDTHDVP